MKFYSKATICRFVLTNLQASSSHINRDLLCSDYTVRTNRTSVRNCNIPLPMDSWESISSARRELYSSAPHQFPNWPTGGRCCNSAPFYKPNLFTYWRIKRPGTGYPMRKGSSVHLFVWHNGYVLNVPKAILSHSEVIKNKYISNTDKV